MTKIDKLKQCFVETFDLPPEEDVTALRYQGITAWDSVGHMQLVLAIENAFDVMLDTQDVLDMSSFAKAVEIVGKYGVDLAA